MRLLFAKQNTFWEWLQAKHETTTSTEGCTFLLRLIAATTRSILNVLVNYSGRENSPDKHSLHVENIASLILKLFINDNKRCHTPSAWAELFFKCKQHTINDSRGPFKITTQWRIRYSHQFGIDWTKNDKVMVRTSNGIVCPTVN